MVRDGPLMVRNVCGIYQCFWGRRGHHRRPRVSTNRIYHHFPTTNEVARGGSGSKNISRKPSRIIADHYGSLRIITDHYGSFTDHGKCRNTVVWPPLGAPRAPQRGPFGGTLFGPKRGHGIAHYRTPEWAPKRDPFRSPFVRPKGCPKRTQKGVPKRDPFGTHFGSPFGTPFGGPSGAHRGPRY